VIDQKNATILTSGPSVLDAAAPLGPDSLTWRYLGDARNVLLAQRSGLLQAMHPAIGAAIHQHSNVSEDPLGRLARSAGPILGVVFDQDFSGTARWVRDQHPPIRGVDELGRRYFALDPDTYFWAHATFVEAQIATQELFGEPLSLADRRQLYAESISWYARYGLTMRPVPPDYEAFCRYWQHMVTDVLEPTAVARAAVRYGRDLAQPAKIPVLRGPAWKVLGPFVAHAGPWLVRATLPPEAREVLKADWHAWDQAGFELLRRGVRAAWPLVPEESRRLPRARQADRRVASAANGHIALQAEMVG
jgi:uncharacterized protein (DUF2236 family)